MHFARQGSPGAPPTPVRPEHRDKIPGLLAGQAPSGSRIKFIQRRDHLRRRLPVCSSISGGTTPGRGSSVLGVDLVFQLGRVVRKERPSTVIPQIFGPVELGDLCGIFGFQLIAGLDTRNLKCIPRIWLASIFWDGWALWSAEQSA